MSTPYFCRAAKRGDKPRRLWYNGRNSNGKDLKSIPDQVTINMRRVVENALNANASLVVLSHNHPSGVALPSKEDNQTTLQIKRALADIGVQLVDHVIVADGDFVCLRDNGLLD